MDASLESPAPKAIAALYPDAVAALIAAATRKATVAAFLQRGWARALLRLDPSATMREIVTLRGRLDAIQVSEEPADEWAAQYQRVAFRRDRIAQALGQYGTTSRATWGKDGYVRANQAEIDAENRDALAKTRARAHRAKSRAKEPRTPTSAMRDEQMRRDYEHLI